MIITDESKLRVPCTDVPLEEIGALRDQLEIELKNSAKIKRPGIGLAAIQIGIPLNMAIIRIDDANTIDLVNCRIDKGYDKGIFKSEGCLSYPGKYEDTMRYQEIYVVGNAIGHESFICTGLTAVAIQHELDHWTGKLLPDLALPKQKEVRKKSRPNDPCHCGSLRKYKKCCGKK